MPYANTIETVKEIGLDTIKTVTLLAALSLVHATLTYTHATDSFKALFTTVHESVLLATYILLAVKSILRMAKL